MLGFFCQASSAPSASKLFDEKTFYQAFRKDLAQSKYEVLIESPFITGRRVESLLPMLRKAIKRGVKIVVNTRDPLLTFSPNPIRQLYSVYYSHYKLSQDDCVGLCMILLNSALSPSVRVVLYRDEIIAFDCTCI